MHVLHVVGARPNFIKAAPLLRALDSKKGIRQSLVHTGQHYDRNMSEVFFKQLGMREPDVNLGVGSASHAQQTAQIMAELEPKRLARSPDLTLVYGDVNSTLAATLVCVKLLMPVGHVEAGLRSYDRTMPEEINRVVTDSLSDLLFTPSVDGDENLLNEGVDRAKIHLVGNVMIDSLVRVRDRAEKLWPLEHIESPSDWGDSTGLRDAIEGAFGLVTLHRPSNVDDEASFLPILSALTEIAHDLPLVMPVHPRTAAKLRSAGIASGKNFWLVPPLGYLEFLLMQSKALVVITDSGGVQEETTFLGVPCITLRSNTERPVTVSLGTNVVIGGDMERLKREVNALLAGEAKVGAVPPLWDGHTAPRIADIIAGEGTA